MAIIPVAQENSVQSQEVWLVADTTTPANATAPAHETAPVVTEGDAAQDAAATHDAVPASAETHEGTVANADDGAHAAAFPPFDSSTFASQLLWLALTFGALYFLMSKLALPRIGEILEVRRDNIESKLAEAERMRQKTDQALHDYETALANAKSKALDIAEETRTKVKADLDGKRTKVESELTQKITEAETRIQATKAEAMGNVDEIAAETAQALVAQVAGKVTQKAAREAVAKVSKELA